MPRGQVQFTTFLWLVHPYTLFYGRLWFSDEMPLRRCLNVFMKFQDFYNALLLFNARYDEGYKFRPTEKHIKTDTKWQRKIFAHFQRRDASKSERSFSLRSDVLRSELWSRPKSNIGLINKRQLPSAQQFATFICLVSGYCHHHYALTTIFYINRKHIGTTQCCCFYFFQIFSLLQCLGEREKVISSRKANEMVVTTKARQQYRSHNNGWWDSLSPAALRPAPFAAAAPRSALNASLPLISFSLTLKPPL